MKRVKTVLAILTILIMVSCGGSAGGSPKGEVNDLAYFEFNGADYWAWTYDSLSTKQDLLKHADRNSNPQKSVYHFYFSDTTSNMSKLGTDRFNLYTFAKAITELKPSYDFLKMNDQPMDEETALFMMEQLALELDK